MLTALMAMVAAATATAPTTNPVPCAAAPDIAFVCGLRDPEDLVAIPGKPWVIASSYPRSGPAGDLYLVDTRTRTATPMNALRTAGAAPAQGGGVCAPPDPARFVAHGIALRPGPRDRHTLYVVNHGGREAIETFAVDTSGPKPTIRWVGCLIAPAGVEPNSVIGLSDGGLMFTTLYDPGVLDWSKRTARLATAAPSGAVYEWHRGGGFKRVAIPPMSGPNGIEISRDEKTIFLAGWADRILWRVDRAGKPTALPVKLDFLPDNLHWAPDGDLLVAGQPVSVADMFACNFRKDKPVYCSGWAVAALDPATMRLRGGWTGRAGDGFGDGTTALLIDGSLWLGSINGDRIAIVDPAKTSAAAR